MGAEPAFGDGVLVVDDDASIRLLCRINLELDGWRVHEAETLAAARTIVRSEQLAVVLVDVHVGSENGGDLVRELKHDRPELPVALLTGSTGTTEGDRVSADAVIPKPFALEVLTATVRRLATPIESSR